MDARERPLAGRSVLLTRPPERASSLATRLEALGARVDARPTIALVPPLDPRPARRLVRELESFDWLVFTSANGVRFFHELWRERRDAADRKLPTVAAIGPATARELVRHGHRPAVVADDSRAEGLARALAGHLLGGERVLVVRPAVAREVLATALAGLGARATSAAFYRNVPSPEVEAVATDISRGRYDLALISSPSSLERLLDAGSRLAGDLRGALGRVRLVAIGPVTGRAIERAGLPVAAIAETPTDDDVVRCVLALYG